MKETCIGHHLIAFSAVVLGGAGLAQTPQNYVAYPSDTTVGASINNAPMGRNGTGSTDEARSQIVVPAAFLPPTGGLLVAIEAIPGNAAVPLTYATLEIRAANLLATVPAPALSNTFATNLGTAPVLVFSRQNFSIAWTPRTWTQVPFSTPFLCLPGHHLVLDFQKAISCPATGGFGHLSPYDERTPLGTTFNLPIMRVAYGACGSNQHRSPVNTSNGGRYPPRLRLVFQGLGTGAMPTTVAINPSPTLASWTLGNSVDLQTQASVAAFGLQLVDLTGVQLAARAAPTVAIPAVAGVGWIALAPPPIVIGTGLFAANSATTTIAFPANPGLAGLHLVIQSVLLNPPSMAPVWTNALDGTLR